MHQFFDTIVNKIDKDRGLQSLRLNKFSGKGAQYGEDIRFMPETLERLVSFSSKLECLEITRMKLMDETSEALI